MDPLTHLATGVICSQLLPGAVPVVGRPGRGHLRGAAGRGLFFHLLGPPGLYPLSSGLYPLPGGPAPLRPGRGARWAGSWAAPAGSSPCSSWGWWSWPSHLLLDLATSYGTQILSPFSRRRFTLDWIFIIDPYFTALLLAGAISRPGLSPLGPPGREPGFWPRPRSICWSAPPTTTRPWTWPAGYCRTATPGGRPWPPCPNPFPAAAGN